MLGKFSLLHLVIQNNSAVVDVKMNGYVLDEKLSLMMLGLPFSSKLSFSPFLIEVFAISQMLKCH